MKTITEKEAFQIANDNANVLVQQLKTENDAHIRETPEDADLLPLVSYEEVHKKLVANFLEIIGKYHVIVPSTT